MSLAEIQRYIVSGIPGVSGILADRLLDNTHSLQILFTTEELDLLKIEGLGEVMAKRIRGIATAEYVSATPGEIKNIAARDQLEKLAVVPDAADEGLDIPPPVEE